MHFVVYVIKKHIILLIVNYMKIENIIAKMMLA